MPSLPQRRWSLAALDHFIQRWTRRIRSMPHSYKRRRAQHLLARAQAIRERLAAESLDATRRRYAATGSVVPRSSGRHPPRSTR